MIHASPTYRLSSIDHQSRYVVSVARLATIAALIVYPILLLWIYGAKISPTYSYGGYILIDSRDEYIRWTGLLLAVLPSCWLPLRLKPVGAISVWILYLLLYVPSQIIPPITTTVGSAQLFLLQVTLLVSLVVLMLANSIRPVPIRTALPQGYYYVGLVVFYMFVFAFVVYYYGIPTSIPSFRNVYDVRLHMREIAQGAPILVAYAFAWFGEVLNPLMVGLGMQTKRLSLVVVGFIGQIYVYALDGAKSALFTIFLVALLLILFKIPGRWPGPLLAAGAVGMVLVSIGLDWLFSSLWFTALLVQRLVITPGILTGFYHEFFVHNERVHFAESLLEPFLDSPYDVNIPFIIGRVYFNSPDTQANASLWADGTANAGVAGIFLVTIVAGALIWTFNSLAIGRNEVLVGIMIGVASLALASASLFTGLLTHGIAISIVLLALSPATSVVSKREVAPLR